MAHPFFRTNAIWALPKMKMHGRTVTSTFAMADAVVPTPPDAAVVVVYGRPSSSNTQKVLWALHEASVPFTLELASALLGPKSQQFAAEGEAYGVVDTPGYLAMNPTARVPTLTDGGFSVFESNTICRYIAQQHCPALFCGGGSAASLAPAQQAATVSTWMDFSLDQNGASAVSFGTLAEVVTRLPEAERGDPETLAKAIGAAAKTIRVLDTRLQAVAAAELAVPFVAGPEFTIGDVPLGCEVTRWFCCLASAKAQGFTLPKPVPSFPHVRSWWERLRERPAFREGCGLQEAAHHGVDLDAV